MQGPSNSRAFGPPSESQELLSRFKAHVDRNVGGDHGHGDADPLAQGVSAKGNTACAFPNI